MVVVELEDSVAFFANSRPRISPATRPLILVALDSKTSFGLKSEVTAAQWQVSSPSALLWEPRS